MNGEELLKEILDGWVKTINRELIQQRKEIELIKQQITILAKRDITIIKRIKQ